jgi:hypothetical protein
VTDAPSEHRSRVRSALCAMSSRISRAAKSTYAESNPRDSRCVMSRGRSWVTAWRGPVDVELDGTLRSSVITKSAWAGYAPTSPGLGRLARPLLIAMYLSRFNTIEVRLLTHFEGIPREVEHTLRGEEYLARWGKPCEVENPLFMRDYLARLRIPREVRINLRGLQSLANQAIG